MAEHGPVATTIASNVSAVRKEPVVVNQAQVINASNTRTQPAAQPSSRADTNAGGTAGNPSAGSGTPPTGDTGGDTGGSGVSGGNDGSTNQNETPAQTQAKPTLDGMAIDDMAALSDKELEEKYKELAEKGFDVDEIKNKVETAKTTSKKQTPKGDDGRKNAGKVDGLMDDPDWGKPLDDKFDIQQGDFIEFLMKDVVLASAAWTGNKVFGITGYGIYKSGSWAWHKLAKKKEKGEDKYYEDKKKSDEKLKKTVDEINNTNLYSGVLKHDDKTNSFAKKILDARKKLLTEAEQSPEVKSADALLTYVGSTIRGEMDIDGAVRRKDGKYTITRNYKDDEGKEKSQKITVDEKTFNTLVQLDKNVKETLSRGGDEKAIREAMNLEMSAMFKNRVNLLLNEKIFAANYASSVLIERAARMTPEELAKLKPEKELQTLAKGEGKLAFYHHLYDIEHRKPEAFKEDKNKTALEVLSGAGKAAVQESVDKLNNSQYREAYIKDDPAKGEKKEPPHNAALQRIFINGKSEYAPELEGMTEPQRETSLKTMQQDAIEGYNRYDRLNNQQQAIDSEISAIAADAQNAGQRKIELEQRKKTQKTEYDKGTAQRDTARAAALNNIRGNSK